VTAIGIPDRPTLAAVGVAKSFGPVEALGSADFEVEPGEIHALLGANGAGKSTLVKILSGVHRADAGVVHVDGEPTRLDSPAEARRAGIATVFQDPALVPDLTIAENLRLSRTDPADVGRWLGELGFAGLDLGQPVRRVPLEKLRIIDLAVAVAHRPRVLLLDEITAALSADQADRVFDLLRSITDDGSAVVLITHRLAEVLRVCDRATILRDGRSVDRLDTTKVDEYQLVEAMLGAPVEPAEHTAAAEHRDDTPIALEARRLSSGDVVHNVSFQVRAGEILGLVALEGQGQDRLFDLLSGNLRPSGGELVVDGRTQRFRSPHTAVQEGVVLVPGDRLLALLPSLSVRQNLGVTLFTRVARWLRIAGDEQARVGDAIGRLDIDTRAGAQVRRLSGGNQQKVAIGRWLVGGFRTLLCFDPTRGIDIGTKREIYALLRELAAGGAAVVLYTSELQEVPLVCDRVLVIHDGRVADEQIGSEATEESMLQAAHGLTVAS
jgi:ribose transport system ATP-binding protein